MHKPKNHDVWFNQDANKIMIYNDKSDKWVETNKEGFNKDVLKRIEQEFFQGRTFREVQEILKERYPEEWL